MITVPLTGTEALLVTKIVKERNEALDAIRRKELGELSLILANYELPENQRVEFVGTDEGGMNIVYEEEVSQPSS
ncbi:MAG TPA: hypothetical protein VMX15_00015 [Candidatus Heimdallarchaeota archaeon]|nr:hypothetical protein [Candidatus Heimdallarchaeota archaeon]